eukprot:symbB.v1.2.027787.t1/scaffold2875.1/size68334/8
MAFPLRRILCFVLLFAGYQFYCIHETIRNDASRDEVPIPEDWIQLSPRDLAFYFQTNQVSRRMEFSIASVRKLFPEAPFYLMSDGGPSFDEVATKWNVSAVHAAMPMHLAAYANPNFTCHRLLRRFEEAARWAEALNAQYLMIWEEDTRMLRPLHGLPDADMITMGNVRNDHCGSFTPQSIEFLMRKKPEELQPGDARRKKQADRYAARNGYSAGPCTVVKIKSFLTALQNSSAADLDAMYAVQDLCFEDFALSNNLVVKRSPEVQQITGPFMDLDHTLRQPKVDDLWQRNLHCLTCLDSCKSSCECAPNRSLLDSMRALLAWLIGMWNAKRGVWQLSHLLWERPCEECALGFSCWSSCRAGCMKFCPAALHPHKGTTLDCEKDPLPSWPKAKVHSLDERDGKEVL